MGVSATLSFVSRVLPDNLKFCHPNTATPEQMLQVVISFVESNPSSIGCARRHARQMAASRIADARDKLLVDCRWLSISMSVTEK
jgi:hypothetical protein